MQRKYELVYIVSPEVPEEGLEATIERIGRLVSNQGGTVEQINIWGRRRLAYPIKRFHEGSYVQTLLTLPADGIRSLEDSFRVAEDVVRHLLVRMEE